jgi:PAS domain S-box-containing protein
MRSLKARSGSREADRRGWLRRWWLDRQVGTKGLIVIAIPLITLAAVTSATLVLGATERHERAQALKAFNLTQRADAVLADAVNAETGVRGYAATRDPIFLDPYNLALTRMAAERRALARAARAGGDPVQERTVNATTGQVMSELAKVRSAIARGASDPAISSLLKAQKMTMDRLRSQVAVLAQGPTVQLIPQRAAIARVERTTEILDIAGLVLGILAGLVGVALFTSGISRRVTAAVANADRLGEGLPLEPVERSSDDLGRLGSSIVRAGNLIAGRAAERDRPRLALLGAIVDSSDDAIVSSNLDGQIMSWNPSAERIYGYPAAEAVGQQATLVVCDDLRREEAELLRAYAGGQGDDHGQGSKHHETVQQRKDGTTFPAAVMLSAIRDDDGTLIGTSSISRDISDQRRARVELQSRMDDLERANQNLETFTYSVSHDLRAPLRSLAGFSTALQEDYADRLDDDGREYTERIQGASGRMAELIEDLLHLSRLWRTELADVQIVDLSAEVARIADDLRGTAPDRQVRFIIQDAVEVPADHVLIRSVLENLVGNAWKFTSRQPDASIEFGTLPVADAAVCCYVRDNGSGFDPAYAEKLFTPFERLHSVNDFPGSGIGLASVSQIVERHGGRVWAEGAVGEGATFYFTLNVEVNHDEPVYPAGRGQSR